MLTQQMTKPGFGGLGQKTLFPILPVLQLDRSIADFNSGSTCSTGSGLEIWNHHSSETSSQNSRNTAHGFHFLEFSCSHPKAVVRPTVFKVDNLLQLRSEKRHLIA